MPDHPCQPARLDHTFRSVPPRALPRNPRTDLAAALTSLAVVAVMFGLFTILRVPAAPRPAGAAALSPISTAVAAETRTPRSPGTSVSAAVFENHRQAQALVGQWAQTYAGREPDAHLALYSSVFRPPGGVTRPAWESERRKAVLFAERIDAAVRDLRIEHVSPERLVAHFEFGDARGQRVTLTLGRERGQWRVVSEAKAPLVAALAG
jgi:hypothetical protein